MGYLHSNKLVNIHSNGFRPGDDYNDTIERTIISLENRKDRTDYGRAYDTISDNIPISAPPVTAG